MDSVSRSFQNPFGSLQTQDEGDLITPEGALTQEFREKLKENLKLGLKSIEGALSSSQLYSDYSVYTGTTGIALLYLHIALSLDKEDDPDFKKELYLQKAADLISRTLAQLPKGPVTFLCGSPGPLAVGAIVFNLLGRSNDASHCVSSLVNIASDVIKDAKLPNELLYGRAGYLYALLFVNNYMPGTIKETLIEEIAKCILDAGKAGRDPSIPSPLMYEWHGKQYLGAAHGICGILTLLLQIPSSPVKDEAVKMVQQCLPYLLSIQYPSGNFPSSVGSATDRLVHWCHGSPGFVHLLAHSYNVIGNENYLKVARKACNNVWERGLLLKGYSICHGASGNGYAFLQMYKTTKERKYLNCACKFAEWCWTSEKRKCMTPDNPFSLFEGLAGVLYFNIDLLVHNSHAYFPAFEV